MKYWIRSQYQGPRGGMRKGMPVSSKRYDTYQEAMDECRKLASCFHAFVERAPRKPEANRV
jgi:hypothetical protein